MGKTAHFGALLAIGTQAMNGQICSSIGTKAKAKIKQAGAIEAQCLLNCIADYNRNHLVQFLSRLFLDSPEMVQIALGEYLIGTWKGERTVFWQIDQNRVIRTGKLIAYNATTGRRRKDVNPSWVHSELKRDRLLPHDFELGQCFFGEHLLPKYPTWPIGIVEAEKTALIASICKGVFPDMIWLACGGKTQLSAQSIVRLGRNRKVILFPDSDGFERWQEIASEGRALGMQTSISTLIERLASSDEKRMQVDLADYLIGLQTEVNRCNERIHQIQTDPLLLTQFNEICEERKSIMMLESRVTDEIAEAYVCSMDFIKQVIFSL